MSNDYRDVLDQDALDALDEVTGGDIEFLAELVETFLEDAPNLMAELQQAIEASNAGEVRRLAHSLKGNGREFGATDFTNLCADLEHQAADGNLADAQGLLNEIQAEFPRVNDALLDYLDA